jgi:hypothetical protein
VRRAGIREQRIPSGGGAVLPSVDVRTRLSAPPNCLRNFAQISLCDAQRAASAKNIFRGCAPLDHLVEGRSRIDRGACMRCTEYGRDVTRLHKTRRFFAIRKIVPRVACIDRRLAARGGCAAIESARGRGGKKFAPDC